MLLDCAGDVGAPEAVELRQARLAGTPEALTEPLLGGVQQLGGKAAAAARPMLHRGSHNWRPQVPLGKLSILLALLAGRWGAKLHCRGAAAKVRAGGVD